MTIVHVNRGRIDSNRKHSKEDPVIRIQEGSKITYSNRVEVLDKNGEVAGTFIYNPNGILKCGAKVVLEAPFGARALESA